MLSRFAPADPLATVRFGSLLLLGAALLGGSMVVMPFVVTALAVGGLGLIVLAIITHTWPDESLGFTFFLLLFGFTKFRERDPLETLGGAIDAQIMWELGAYTAAFLVALIVWRSRSFPRWSLSPVEGLLGSFVIVAFLSAAWSPVMMLTVVRGWQLAVLLFVGFVATRFLGPTRTMKALLVSTIVYVLIGSATAVLFPRSSLWVGVYQGLRHFVKDPASESARFAWFALHPITVGAIAGCASLYVIAHTLRFDDVSQWWRRWRWPAMGLLVTVVVASHSRGPLAAFIGGLGVLVVYRIAKSRNLLVLVPVAAAFAIVTLVFIPSPLAMLDAGAAKENAIATFLLRDGSTADLVGGNGRVELWQAMVPLILERPIFGNGYLASRVLLMDKVPWGPGHAHNGFMQSLLDFGLIGTLLLWVPLLGTLLLKRPRASAHLPHIRRTQAVIVSVTMLLVLHSMGDPSLAGPPGFEVFVVFTCILAAGRVRLGDVR